MQPMAEELDYQLARRVIVYLLKKTLITSFFFFFFFAIESCKEKRGKLWLAVAPGRRRHPSNDPPKG